MVRLAEDMHTPSRRFSMQERLMGFPVILTPFAIVLPTLGGSAVIGAALGVLAVGGVQNALASGVFGWLFGGGVFSLFYNPAGSTAAAEFRAGSRHGEPPGSRVVAVVADLATGIVVALAFVSWRERVIWAVAVGVSLSWLLLTVSALRCGMPRSVLFALPLTILAGLIDAARIFAVCFLVLLARSLIE